MNASHCLLKLLARPPAQRKKNPVFRSRPSHVRLIANVALVSLFAAATLGGAGCSFIKSKMGGVGATSKAAPPVKPKKVVPSPPAIDYAALRPNELGRIPVIMYHEIGGKPYPRDPGLVRSVDSFKQDLELLYQAGFRPVNLGDAVNDTMDLPAGKSPVVLTFDDARATQFRLDDTGKALRIDPNCALGVMDSFHKKHPDWAMRATFFALPHSKATDEPFGQRGLGDQKIAYLVDNGMEIGNHTTLHRSSRHMTPAQLQAEIGNANNELVKASPKVRIRTMAVPMGIFPKDRKNWQYLAKGTYEGQAYNYDAVMDAAYRPMVSPFAKGYNPLRLERISPVDSVNGFRYWLKELTRTGGAYQRYISDGDNRVVSFPKGEEKLANLAKIKAKNKLAYAYSPFGKGSKPIVAGNDKPITMVETPDAASAATTIDTTPPGATATNNGAGTAPNANAATTGAKPITGSGG